MAGVSPADNTVQQTHNEHGKGQMPGVTHGDEHHVAVIAEVPLWSVRRVEDETDLRIWEDGGQQSRGVTLSTDGVTPSTSAALSYLPEPGSLQDGEGAAQQLKQDVAAVEDLQEGHQCAAEDRVEKQLVHKDVQHGPAVQVVEEEESCENTHTHTHTYFQLKNIQKCSHSCQFIYTYNLNMAMASSWQDFKWPTDNIISPLDVVVFNYAYTKTNRLIECPAVDLTEQIRTGASNPNTLSRANIDIYLKKNLPLDMTVNLFMWTQTNLA